MPTPVAFLKPVHVATGGFETFVKGIINFQDKCVNSRHYHRSNCKTIFHITPTTKSKKKKIQSTADSAD